MTVTETSLPDVLLFEPDVYADRRGFFMELWQTEAYEQHGVLDSFVQDNLSWSKSQVLRGLHFQNPRAQGKIVSVLRGQIFDVAVDIRKGSETFGHWVGLTLSAENNRQLYIPPGFAHGFVVTGDCAMFHYKCSDFYSPNNQHTIRWDDPDLGIDWPTKSPIVSDKDRNAPQLDQLPNRLFEFQSPMDRSSHAEET